MFKEGVSGMGGQFFVIKGRYISVVVSGSMTFMKSVPRPLLVVGDASAQLLLVSITKLHMNKQNTEIPYRLL